MDGYICLYRKMLSWEWMQEPYTAHLFTCLLLLANQDEGWEYMGIKLHAGQLITSLDKLGERTGLTKKLVRTRLERLQRSGELEVQSYKMGTLITIKTTAVTSTSKTARAHKWAQVWAHLKAL